MDFGRSTKNQSKNTATKPQKITAPTIMPINASLDKPVDDEDNDGDVAALLTLIVTGVVNTSDGFAVGGSVYTGSSGGGRV